MILRFKKRGIRIAEVWFDQQFEITDVDVIMYSQRPVPVDRALCIPKHTLLIDLKQDTDLLFSSCYKGCQYNIRKSRDKDGVSCKTHNALDREIQAWFCSIYNEFAVSKKLQKLDAKYLGLIAEAGALDISSVSDSEGNLLVFHTHLLISQRARQLHSVSILPKEEGSQRRNFIGRANRYLHWWDMLRFKSAGYAVYDWGGWCADSDNKTLQGINRFKEEFGGIVKKEWNCNLAVTFRGRIALWLYHRLRHRG